MTELPIARNTALLSASLAANSGMLQLQAAVASMGFNDLLPTLWLASRRAPAHAT